MNSLDKCEHCREPTKRVTGFWDGFDRVKGVEIHGNTYSCKNHACPVQLAAEAAMQKLDAQRKEAIAENRANGVSATVLDSARLAARVTIYELAKYLGITSSHYCRLRDERMPIDKDMYRKALGWLETRKPAQAGQSTSRTTRI